MKKAFTLLELVFVIVIIGILAAVIIPNTRTNPVTEASIQLESHIRYAQHLALMDDKFDSDPTVAWYQNIWQIAFSGDQYSIMSNDVPTYAQDPLTGNAMQDIDLNADFGVDIDNSNCNNSISFDHLGRPITGSLSVVGSATDLYNNILTSPCNIVLSNGNDENVTITIEPETGYARRILP